MAIDSTVRLAAERHETHFACAANTGLFMALAAVSVTFFSHSILNAIQLALSSEEYSYLLLVPAVSVLFIVMDRGRIFETRKLDLKPALAITAAGFSGIFVARSFSRYELTLDIATLLLSLLAAFMLAFGRAAFVRARFPLLLLCLAVPIPANILAGLISVLQHGSTGVAYKFLQLASIPVRREGPILFLPNVNIEVAAECSGIRSTMLLAVTSLVIANTFLRSAWKQMLVALLILPIAILKNGVRIFLLSAAAVCIDPAILSSWVHHSGGFIFFLLGLAMVALVVWLLQRCGKAPAVYLPSLGLQIPAMERSPSTTTLQ